MAVASKTPCSISATDITLSVRPLWVIQLFRVVTHNPEGPQDFSPGPDGPASHPWELAQELLRAQCLNTATAIDRSGRPTPDPESPAATTEDRPMQTGLLARTCAVTRWNGTRGSARTAPFARAEPPQKGLTLPGRT